MLTASCTAAHAADADTRYVLVQGQRVAYRAIGSGIPLLLANRMRGTLDAFNAIHSSVFMAAARRA